MSHLIITDVRLKCSSAKFFELAIPHSILLLSGWGIECNFTVPLVILCTWLFPLEDEVMINIDGSKKDNNGGYGAILRDHLGTPLSAACGGIVPATIEALELQGVELGLKLDKFKRHRRLHISTDSSVVYKLLSDIQAVLA